jgi:uncharacterized PurR-regulated membrane protein YhhQ (DUF165 family)
MIANPFTNSQDSSQYHAFKLYTFLVALFIVLRTEAIMFVNKQITIFYVTTTVSGITLTINFLILAIVTSCYGKQSARQLLWINNVIALQFIIYNVFANSFDWSVSGNQNLEIISAYKQLIPLFIKAGGFGLIGENVADFLFVFLYSKRKNKQPIIVGISKLSEYFILFKCSFLANLAMLAVAYSGIFFKNSFLDILTLILQVLFVKTATEIILSPLVICLIIIIKHFEGFEVLDNSGYNPFKFKIEMKYLNFIKSKQPQIPVENNNANSY